MKAKALVGTLRMLGEAAGRVGAEYKDLARQQKWGTEDYSVLLYMRPLSRPDQVRLQERIAGSPKTEEVDEFKEGELAAAALRRQTLAMLCVVPAPTADGAVVVALAVVREALHAEDLELNEIHLEARRRPA